MSVNYKCKGGKTPPSPPKPVPLPPLTPIPSYPIGDAAYKVVTLGYGTISLEIDGKAPIQSIQFLSSAKAADLAKVNLPTNYTLAPDSTDMGYGRHLYTISFDSTSSSAKPATKITLGQLPIYNMGLSTKGSDLNAALYGLPTHMAVAYASSSPQTSSADPTPEYKLAKYDFSALQGFTPIQSPDSSKYLVGDYYANWTQYATHGFDPTYTPLANVNFLVYGFFGIDPVQGKATDLDPYGDFGKKSPTNKLSSLLYYQLQRLADPKHALNLSLSFGGWGTVDGWGKSEGAGFGTSFNYTSGDFGVLFEYEPDKIKPLADDMVTAMLKAGYNGIDIDYEWTAPEETQAKYLPDLNTCQKVRGSKITSCALCKLDPTTGNVPAAGSTCQPLGIDQRQADGYAALLYYIQQDFQQLEQQQKDTSQHYILSTALMAGTGPSGLGGFSSLTNQGDLIPGLKGKNDLVAALSYVDVINLMTYDMHADFDAPAPQATATDANVSNFQAELQVDPKHDPLAPNLPDNSIEKSVKYLETTVQVPPNKILMGIPAYGHISQLATPKNIKTSLGDEKDGLYQTLANSDQQGISAYNYGEYSGDVWTQDFTGNGTDSAAKGQANKISPGIRGSSTFDYRCIKDKTECKAQFTIAKTPDTIFTQEEFHQPSTTAGGTGYYAKTPWAYSPENHVFLSYDDNKSTNIKTIWAKQQGLRGGFIWEADSDLLPSDNSGTAPNDSIIYNIYQPLFKA